MQQEIVEALDGPTRWERPKTDGYIVGCLELVGVSVRGKKLTRAELLRLANENGLPFTDSDETEKRTKDDR